MPSDRIWTFHLQQEQLLQSHPQSGLSLTCTPSCHTYVWVSPTNWQSGLEFDLSGLCSSVVFYLSFLECNISIHLRSAFRCHLGEGFHVPLTKFVVWNLFFSMFFFEFATVLSKKHLFTTMHAEMNAHWNSHSCCRNFSLAGISMNRHPNYKKGSFFKWTATVLFEHTWMFTCLFSVNLEPAPNAFFVRHVCVSSHVG